MYIQKMFTGKHPYFISYTGSAIVREHRHAELELLFCLSGEFVLCIDNTEYLLSAGNLAIIGSMIPHSIPEYKTPDSNMLCMEAGPVLLGDSFPFFSKVKFTNPIYNLSSDDFPAKERQEFSKLLWELADLNSSNPPITSAELLYKGNLYKIFYYIHEMLQKENQLEQNQNSLQDILKIEATIKLIHDCYSQPLTVKDAAALAQYSESNFCKTFKKITGDTFHNTLNRYRIRNACYLLKDSNLSINEIALQVGFVDTKTFCRVFKNYTGHTPSTFRKDKTLTPASFSLI